MEELRYDYDEACKNATTRQGLDPLVARLESENIVGYVEQTGGFCMVMYVRTDDTHEIGITDDGGWLVCEYDTAIECHEGVTLASGLESLDEVVAILRGKLNG